MKTTTTRSAKAKKSLGNVSLTSRGIFDDMARSTFLDCLVADLNANEISLSPKEETKLVRLALRAPYAKRNPLYDISDAAGLYDEKNSTAPQFSKTRLSKPIGILLGLVTRIGCGAVNAEYHENNLKEFEVSFPKVAKKLKVNSKDISVDGVLLRESRKRLQLPPLKILDVLSIQR